MSEVIQWSTCLPHLQLSLNSTIIDVLTQVRIPEVYEDVFSEAKTDGLSAYRSYACAIDLLPGTTLPRGRVYLYRHKEPWRYTVQEALDQKYIVPSTSPASEYSSLLKEGGGLQPGVDYQGLNNITVKYPYLLSLMPGPEPSARGQNIY